MEHCIMPDNPPWWRNYEAVKNHRDHYHRHEIFFGPNRQHSIEDGLVVFLRPNQHNMGPGCIHRNRDYDLIVKRAGQTEYEKTHSHEEFMQRYGKNYL